MNNSRSVEHILKEIREAYLGERRSDVARSGDNNQIVVSLRGGEPTLVARRARRDIDQLTVVWPSSNSKR